MQPGGPQPACQQQHQAGWDCVCFQPSCQLHWGLLGSLRSSALQAPSASRGNVKSHCLWSLPGPSFLPHNPPWRLPSIAKASGMDSRGLARVSVFAVGGEMSGSHAQIHTGGVTQTDQVCSSHEKVSLELPGTPADTEIPLHPSPSALERARAPPDPCIPRVPGPTEITQEI